MTRQNTDALFQRFYYGRPDFENGTDAFHRLCRMAISPPARILEIGAGPSNETSDFLGNLGELQGVDVSHEVTGNRALRRAHVFNGEKLPFEDGAFDACVSNYVLEHVANPETHFAEVARVLRPGGAYVIRTPNLFYYISLFSAVMPHSVHRLLANRARGLGADSHEPWPTVYRANTGRKIRHIAQSASLDVEQCTMVEKEPFYGRASPVLFFPMMLWERLVNSTPYLGFLRANIFCVLRKTSSQEE